ncbi:MAG: hypothetical protein ABI211_06195 [Vicinamibacterales bacterium]
MSNVAPPELPYFLDRMLSGSKIADRLRNEQLAIQVIEDHHGVRTPDQQWLATVGRKGWLALTRDEDIRRQPLILEAVRRSGARMFCLTAQRLTADGICDLVLKSQPVLQEIARAYTGPFIANVGRNGDVRFIRGGTPHIVFNRSTTQQATAHRWF